MEREDALDFKLGEKDGRLDGAKGVKPIGQMMMKLYSRSYQEGYSQGYDKASEPRRARAAGAV